MVVNENKLKNSKARNNKCNARIGIEMDWGVTDGISMVFGKCIHCMHVSIH